MARIRITKEVVAVRPTFATREEWLIAASGLIAPLFAEHGHSLPPFAVSCSWPGGGSARTRIGECWPTQSSTRGVNEIFISPLLSDPIKALGVLVHELVHAIDNCASKHGKPFAKLARQVGLVGKMTCTQIGPALLAGLEEIAAELGEYPHSNMILGPARKKKAARGRIRCDSCEKDFRVSPKQVASVEYCPFCGEGECLKK